MDAKGYIQRQVASVRRTSDAVTGDLQEEQLGWTPPGTANPIGATLLHAVHSEDAFVRRTIQGQATTFDSGAWAEKLGVAAEPGKGPSWEGMKGKPLSLAQVLDYQNVVRAETDAYLAGLTPEELDRQVMTFRGEMPVGAVLALYLGHQAHHFGEIAALKGAQGAKGLPF
ncbi:MAG: DinB family protein [Chloroflexi bacterium]|nr:DinB family protein [Chloroflexota bacterium]MCL5108518.1 DinB family protein [Chloroflexota bacterium]